MSTTSTAALLAETVTRTVAATAASATSSHKVAPQGGILEGGNPSIYDPKNPIFVFIIQAGIIIIFCRLLHYPLSWLRQPRVIAEVIGGILLGPSVMGRIPGFTNAIFPTASIPNLSLVANLGLILFLFLVGLEVDLRYFAQNWKIALSVGTAGMALPFGLGCAIAYGLYHEFHDDTAPIAFGTYMLFIGVAMAITAFPVLCRILTELQLLQTPVGVIVLSAGVSNDVVGWVLLALCVALVNAGSGLTALWVLLTCAGYALFLIFAVRPAFMLVLRRTGALQDGPSQSVVALTLMIALASAFFTGVIGVHPIFGAFMAGLICPHEGGFAIKVTEKIEDLVSAIFLPLYFALSGLSTNLGLLDNGITWAYVVAVIAVAFSGKFIGASIAARLNGLVWRESFTIGALMSCKGLVELIVLNIGLQARILSTRTFTIFVVMALVTTFATTPLTSALYPPWYQRKLEAWKRGEIDWDTGALLSDSDAGSRDTTPDARASIAVRNLLVYLRLDSMPALLSFVSLLGQELKDATPQDHPSTGKQPTVSVTVPRSAARNVQAHGIRLLELTERSSTVMQVSEVEEYSAFDPVLNVFRMLGQLFHLSVSGEATVVPEARYAETLTSKATEESTDLLLLPWSDSGSLSDSIAMSAESIPRKLDSTAYATFIGSVFDTAPCDAVVFVHTSPFSHPVPTRPSPLSRTVSSLSLRTQRDPHPLLIAAPNRPRHIYLPYFGAGKDDDAALRLVLQLAENPLVTVTVVHLATSEGGAGAAFDAAVLTLPETRKSRVLLERVALPPERNPLDEALARAQTELPGEKSVGNVPSADLVVLGRNALGLRDTGDRSQLSVAAPLGAAADVFAASGLRASLLVMQGRP